LEWPLDFLSSPISTSQTASQAGLWLIISTFGALTGSLSGGLIMQKTGKYYRLTVISYFTFVLGTIVVNSSTGIIVSSTIGIAAGKYFLFIFSLFDLIKSNNETNFVTGMMISSVGTGEPSFCLKHIYTDSSLHFF
jgi:hypothetical protein